MLTYITCIISIVCLALNTTQATSANISMLMQIPCRTSWYVEVCRIQTLAFCSHFLDVALTLTSLTLLYIQLQRKVFTRHDKTFLSLRQLPCHLMLCVSSEYCVLLSVYKSTVEI